jgi:hypothetical protein
MWKNKTPKKSLLGVSGTEKNLGLISNRGQFSDNYHKMTFFPTFDHSDIIVGNLR